MAEALTYTLIASTSLSSAGFSLTSIPNTYTDLRLVLTGVAASGGGSTWNGITFNGNTGSNYYNYGFLGSATAMGSNIYRQYSQLAWSGQSSFNTTYAGNLTVDIFNYKEGSGFGNGKSCMMCFTQDLNSGTGANVMETWSSVWEVTSTPITSIELSSFTFTSGRVSLYGILRG
jgi:hypothetical protein